MLIGGAIGGALPDIDIQGSAVEKLGTKSANLMGKTVGKLGTPGRTMARASSAIGLVLDKVFLGPIAAFWRFISEKFLTKGYRALYELGGKNGKPSLGEKLHWANDDKPYAHRGGITHSLSFMVTSCVLTVPLSLLFQSWALFVGCELGILSHLVADACCKSGVKFFFPWRPAIGFRNESGAARGEDVRILPPRMQVITGKDRITNAELDDYADQQKAIRDRKLRFREKAWQKIFQFTAILVIALLIAGVGVHAAGAAQESMQSNGDGNPIASIISGITSGGKQDFSETGNDNNATGNQPQGQSSQSQTWNGAMTATSPQSSDTGNPYTTQQSDGESGTPRTDSDKFGGNFIPVVSTADVGALGYDINSFRPLTNMRALNDGRVPETAGVTSFTKADVNVKDLPKGIAKLPDESLWVIGVGPVNEANLNNPKWQFTDEEKRWLLSLASSSRLDGIPNNINDYLNRLQQSQQAQQQQQSQQQDENSGGSGNGSSSGSGIGDKVMDALGGITGLDLGNGGGGYSGGFLGLTPYTSS